MAQAAGLILFVMIKAAEWLAIQNLTAFFNMRTDMIALGFWFVLSLFQLAFLAIQTFSGRKGAYNSSLIFQYTTIITVLMDFVILGMTGYYFSLLGNDLFNLLFILVAVSTLLAYFFLAHSAIFSSVIRSHKILVSRPSILPTFLFLVYSFWIPLGYLLAKVLIDRKITPRVTTLDILLVAGVLLLNSVAVFFMFFGKARKARHAARLIKATTQASPESRIVVDDPNEFGYIESELYLLQQELSKTRENVALYSNYLSENIRAESVRYGVNDKGEKKTASVLSLKYGFGGGELAPEMLFKIMDSLTRMIGEYAREYDAYPLFHPHQAVLLFGVPFYYEHQKYNALEAAQTIMADALKIAQDEGVELTIHSGIYTGQVLAGSLHTRGRDLKEYTVFGQAIETAERVAVAAESVNADILVDGETMESLKTKFHSIKTYKIKVSGNGEVVVHQVKK